MSSSLCFLTLSLQVQCEQQVAGLQRMYSKTQAARSEVAGALDVATRNLQAQEAACVSAAGFLLAWSIPWHTHAKHCKLSDSTSCGGRGSLVLVVHFVGEMGVPLTMKRNSELSTYRKFVALYQVTRLLLTLCMQGVKELVAKFQSSLRGAQRSEATIKQAETQLSQSGFHDAVGGRGT